MSSRNSQSVDPTSQLQLSLDSADAPKGTRPPVGRSTRARAAKRPERKASTTGEAQIIASAAARRSTQRPLQPVPRFPLTGGLTGPERGQRAILHSESADPAPESALMFAEEVATMVGMTRKWVYTETRAGRIPHVALGRYYRYRPDSIDAWLRQIEQRRA